MLNFSCSKSSHDLTFSPWVESRITCGDLKNIMMYQFHPEMCSFHWSQAMIWGLCQLESTNQPSYLEHFPLRFRSNIGACWRIIYFETLGKERETSFVRTFILLMEKYIKLIIRRAYVVPDRLGDFMLLEFSFQDSCGGSTAVALWGTSRCVTQDSPDKMWDGAMGGTPAPT